MSSCYARNYGEIAFRTCNVDMGHPLQIHLELQPMWLQGATRLMLRDDLQPATIHIIGGADAVTGVWRTEEDHEVGQLFR
jgi:hypothetical protein